MGLQITVFKKIACYDMKKNSLQAYSKKDE